MVHKPGLGKPTPLFATALNGNLAFSSMVNVGHKPQYYRALMTS